MPPMSMKKAVIPLLIANLLLQPLASLAQTVRSGFNPNVLIQDASFYDMKTFGGPEGIQRFLESKGSILANTSPDFLAKLGEPADPALKQALGDPQPSAGRLRTAAELIWDASRASSLNPQVILVTLHKEQGLVGSVDPNRLQTALNRAMGFDCPDYSGCGNLFPGFYYQLFGNVDTGGNRYMGAAKSLMRSFATPGGRGPSIAGVPAKVGSTVQISNTLGGFDGIPASQTVTLGNLATAALYRYTPHVFNGNYNFWNFFTSWFKYPNGTLLKSTSDGNTFILNDGRRQRLPAFVAAARGLSLGNAVPVSPTELGDYPEGPTYGPTDDTIISLNGTFYVFLDGIRHPASSFVLTQRKLNPAMIMPITPSDASLFAIGTQLTPSEGTVLRAKSGTDVFLVDNGLLKQYSELTFKQYKVAKRVQIIADEEVALYPKQGYVAPLNGTLIKSPAIDAVYVMSDGRRLPLTPELFKNNRYKTKDVFTLTTNAELSSIPMGPPATPREGTYFAMGKELFLFKAGAKHPIFPFVAKQRGIKPDYSFEASIASAWPDGIAIPPSDGALVKSAAAPAVYAVENGQLRQLTAEIFKLRGYSPKKVATLADNEITALAKDGYAEPPANTYFSVADNDEFYVFMNGTKRHIYPFVAKQRGMTPDVTFSAEVAADWTPGIPVAPRENTLIKGDSSDTIFLVVKKVLRPLSDAAFKRRGFKMKKVLTVPQADLDGFTKGDLIAK